MILPHPDMDAHVQRLLAEMDAEIERLRLRLVQLEQLSQALVAGDEESLERLLAQMDAGQGPQAEADARLAEARRALAQALGCPGQRMSQWLARLEGHDRWEIQRRRSSILDLMGRLRRQHLASVTLLAECARVNRLLLDALMPRSGGVTVYGTGGADHWRGGAGLLNAEI